MSFVWTVKVSLGRKTLRGGAKHFFCLGVIRPNFSVFFGEPSEKKIVRSVEVSSKLDQDVLYSREKLEEVLSEALSSAIDQIFTDQELLKRFP